MEQKSASQKKQTYCWRTTLFLISQNNRGSFLCFKEKEYIFHIFKPSEWLPYVSYLLPEKSMKLSNINYVDT